MFSSDLRGFFLSALRSSNSSFERSIMASNEVFVSLISGNNFIRVCSPNPFIPFILSDESPHKIFLTNVFSWVIPSSSTEFLGLMNFLRVGIYWQTSSFINWVKSLSPLTITTLSFGFLC